ncbi:LysR family transcriptional regulator [Acidovorax sp. A79]|uniref:LysR family transcriptional regulator n=1 Tax=unclassified Acidovorax TaxID=2684926 RepID=UPI001C4593DD|nr:MULTISPECIES: LysR family transcriptional regulator [unclassified Acidovorax]MBV7430007.1 LysR family transcriptional regulator [Acidovorax sp. sif0732]MBV7451400.1 LysR family transcriptional regulator [Acidovorax sp. sif0715]
MRNLNLDQVQTLVAIADLGTLAAAAQALHLAPPTVSLHISELESRLGAALVVRGRRQASLTPAGEALVAGGRRLLAGADEVVEQVRRRAQGLEGLVRLATTAGVSAGLLPRLLERLARQSPGVDVKLDVLSSAEAMARLGAGTLDLAIVAMPQAAGRDVQVRPWRTDPMVALIPPAWDAPAQATPQWLAGQRWMSFGPATQMYRLIAGWFAQAGLNPRPRMELNHPLALRSLVGAGHGVAVLPLEQPGVAGGDVEQDNAGLQVRPLSPPLWRELGLARRASQVHDTAILAVWAALESLAVP